MGSWVCVDANIVIGLVTAREAARSLSALWAGWIEDSRPVAAPRLLLYEVTNALHRLRQAGELTSGEAERALSAVLALEMDYREGAVLHLRALELAAELHLPAAYDAHYLALAEMLDADLFTADRRFANAVGARFPRVQLVTGA
jgi:predicted nucleic acid-binding protein